MLFHDYNKDIQQAFSKQKEVLLYLKECGVIPKNGWEAMIHLSELNTECLKSDGYPMFDLLVDYSKLFGNDDSIDVCQEVKYGYLSDSIVEIIKDYAVIYHLKKPIKL